MSSDSLVIGLRPFLDVAWSAWSLAEPARTVRRVEVKQGPDFVFDGKFLAALDRSEAFVAIDHRFLNFKRLELMTILAVYGFKFASVIARKATIGDGARIGTNVFVGEGAVVGPGATIADGACIGARAVVGANAIVGLASWIDPGVIVGTSAQIGEHTTLGSGVIVADGAEIWDECALTVPGLIRGKVGPRTYIHPAFHEPIRVHR